MRVFVSALLFVSLAAAQPQAAPGTAAPAKPARPDGLYATLQTSMGDMVVKLYEKESPITVKNFVDLSLGLKAWTDPKTKARTRRPLYPGTIFHRVIPGFMIQGGSPDAAKDAGSDPIKDEFASGLTFDRPGVVGMANIGEPNTGSSQFYITEVPTPHLNGKHTIFGQVVEGVDLVGKIARVPVQGSRPITPVVLKKVIVERVGPGPAPGRSAAPAKPKPASTAKPAGTAKPATSTPKPATSTKPPAAATKK